MRLGIVRIGMAVCVAGCFLQAVCQTSPSAAPPAQEPSDALLYGTFFLNDVIPEAPLPPNGQPANLAGPRLQEGAGLTDREMKALTGIAMDCRALVGRLYGPASHEVFDALMESIESGKDTYPDPQQAAKDREAKSERIVLLHVEQLRAAFGEARFRKLDAWLRAEDASRPPAQAPKKLQ